MDEPKIPLPATLKKYGLTAEEWLQIYMEQDGRCPICGNPLLNRTNIDHHHVKQWKKLPDEVRKKYVRGILCFFCNKYYLGRGINIQRAENVVKYLKKFEDKIKNAEENQNSPT